MIDEFRGGAAFGAERLAGRMCGIGFEAGEAAVFHDRDCTAPGDAQPAIAVNALQAGVISHRIFSRSSKACSIRPSSADVRIRLRTAYTKTRFRRHARIELNQPSTGSTSRSA